MGLLIDVAPAAPQLIGDTSGALLTVEVPSTPVSGTAAVNTQVQLTITGVAGQTIRITSLSASYNAAPTGGTLTVVVNAVTIFQVDITATGPVSISLPGSGLKCQAGQSAVITLTAAGAAVTGKLNASSYFGQ